MSVRAVVLLLGWSALPAFAADRCPAAVDEFKMSAFGGQYSCRKIACDTTQAFPEITPTPVQLQLVCDGDYRLVARHGGKSLKLDSFDNRERCQRAVDQFRNTQGCYCTNDYVPKCLAKDSVSIRFDEMAAAFSRSEACAKALDQISQSLEAKPR